MNIVFVKSDEVRLLPSMHACDPTLASVEPASKRDELFSHNVPVPWALKPERNIGFPSLETDGAHVCCYIDVEACVLDAQPDEMFDKKCLRQAWRRIDPYKPLGLIGLSASSDDFGSGFHLACRTKELSARGRQNVPVWSSINQAFANRFF
jgi:hypothetical protein